MKLSTQPSAIHSPEAMILILCERTVQQPRGVEINIPHSYKTAPIHKLRQSFRALYFFLLSPFMIWSRSYQGKFSVLLVFQQSAFLDSTCLDMDRIFQCPRSVQSADHLTETVWQFLLLVQQNGLKWCHLLCC